MQTSISMDHKDKVVAITGVSGQLGSLLALQYTDLGAKVIGLDSITPNTSDAKSLPFDYIKLDIRNVKSVDETFKNLVNKFGGVDILVNNAGASTFEHFLDRTEENIDLMMDVNLKGTFNCIKSFVKFGASKNLGRSIVNIGSIYGLVSPDFRVYEEGDRRSSEIYGATKAGVIQMTKYFAVELAKAGIRVNAVSPGGIFNPSNPQGKQFVEKYSHRTPMGRMASTSEITQAIVFLTSSLASYITGHNLVVDGGYSAL
jgi:NAD(P)-dependent dehydrogenase (short-subunit alcohol dehydrogenase family)